MLEEARFWPDEGGELVSTLPSYPPLPLLTPALPSSLLEESVG